MCVRWVTGAGSKNLLLKGVDLGKFWPEKEKTCVLNPKSDKTLSGDKTRGSWQTGRGRVRTAPGGAAAGEASRGVTAEGRREEDRNAESRRSTPGPARLGKSWGGRAHKPAPRTTAPTCAATSVKLAAETAAAERAPSPGEARAGR